MSTWVSGVIAVWLCAAFAASAQTPVANPDEWTVSHNSHLWICPSGVLANDENVVSVVPWTGDTTHYGYVNLHADGSFYYKPLVSFTGADSFAYTAIGDGSLTPTAVVTLHVTNKAPIRDECHLHLSVAHNESVSSGDRDRDYRAEGVQASFGYDRVEKLTRNYWDCDRDDLTVVLLSDTTSGTLDWHPDGSFTYTPDPDRTSDSPTCDSFTYTVSDGLVEAPDATTVYIQITNSEPEARDDWYGFSYAKSRSISSPAEGVLANDYDRDGDPLTAVLIDYPTHGDLVFNADGTFTYTPLAHYEGDDSFTYGVLDPFADSRETLSESHCRWIGTVNLRGAEDHLPRQVCRPDDYFTVHHGQTLTDANTLNLLANYSDFDGDEMAVRLLCDVTIGTLVIDTDGTFLYTPPADWTVDSASCTSFTYTVSDWYGDACESTTVRIRIRDDIPRAYDHVYGVHTGVTRVVTASEGVLSDVCDSDDSLANLTAAVVEGLPQFEGTLTFNSDGSFTYAPDAWTSCTSFTYNVTDSVGGVSCTKRVILTAADNHAPRLESSRPFWGFDTARYTVSHNKTLTVAVSEGLLSNATDIDGDALSATIVSDVNTGTLNVALDGSFTYLPPEGWTRGDAYFSYVASDAWSASCSQCVKIDITNTAPVAINHQYGVHTSMTTTVPASVGVLAGATDADDDSLTAILVFGPEGLTLNADGSFTYAPAEGWTGDTKFTFRVTDGLCESELKTAKVAVRDNNAPVAVPDTYWVYEGETLTVAANAGVLANDYDIDTTDSITAFNYTTTTAVKASGLPEATLSRAADGSFIYTPGAGFYGADSFTYQATDGLAGGQSNVATVDVTVKQVPHPSDKIYAANLGVNLVVGAEQGLMANNVLVAGHDATVAVVGTVPTGLTVNPDGSFTYVPGKTGTISFAYKIVDAVYASNPPVDDLAYVSISVRDPNATSVVYAVTVTGKEFSLAAPPVPVKVKGFLVLSSDYQQMALLVQDWTSGDMSPLQGLRPPIISHVDVKGQIDQTTISANDWTPTTGQVNQFNTLWLAGQNAKVKVGTIPVSTLPLSMSGYWLDGSQPGQYLDGKVLARFDKFNTDTYGVDGFVTCVANLSEAYPNFVEVDQAPPILPAADTDTVSAELSATPFDNGLLVYGLQEQVRVKGSNSTKLITKKGWLVWDSTDGAMQLAEYWAVGGDVVYTITDVTDRPLVFLAPSIDGNKPLQVFGLLSDLEAANGANPSLDLILASGKQLATFPLDANTTLREVAKTMDGTVLSLDASDGGDVGDNAGGKISLRLNKNLTKKAMGLSIEEVISYLEENKLPKGATPLN